jgi:sialate O-acetylesterase
MTVRADVMTKRCLGIASVFTDNMVLQQGMPVPVWGTAKAGTDVIVRFAGQTETATADSDGHWRVWLQPLDAAHEPQSLTAASPESKSVTVSNVLVGEVWICAGQSNMEWCLCNALNPEREIAAAQYPGIRLFTVPQRTAEHPETAMPGAAWRVCAPENARSFSAVGYFFGRELHRRLGVPVGLINASWGGTVAEAWISREGLLAEPALGEMVVNMDRDRPGYQELLARWEEDIRRIEQCNADVENIGFRRGWAGLAEPGGDWKEMELPCAWQKRGINHSGILWFRKIVDLPESWAGKDLELGIGATDKSDVTYFNGEQVGSVTMREREDSWSFKRTYPAPGRLVRAGRNVVAVRVHSDKYLGGMTGPAGAMYLRCTAYPGEEGLPLRGIWRYAVEVNYGLVEAPAMPMAEGNPNMPCSLYHGMIAPMVPVAARGVIWYQGESNVERPLQYRTLLPALIRDWRRVWRREDLAFYFVQLANYLDVHSAPEESQLAELREAQLMTLALPHTGMAVAIDIGEAESIHPVNKQDAGLRLALNALHQTYGQKSELPCGPLLKRATREGNAVRLSFKHAGGGLRARGERLEGFAIAGADRRFVWADARIDGQAVIVSSQAVAEPAAVRYAWADNPVCNLYNSEGLPASPFRTDDWPAAIN